MQNADNYDRYIFFCPSDVIHRKEKKKGGGLFIIYGGDENKLRSIELKVMT